MCHDGQILQQTNMQCDVIAVTDLYNALSVIPGDKHPAPLPVRSLIQPYIKIININTLAQISVSVLVITINLWLLKQFFII